jgi:26S proteasome non-ATPase regulatory subunit 10
MNRASHRAASTGSTGFISILLKPPEAPEGTPKTRLNTADRIGKSYRSSLGFVNTDPLDHPGNTPLHLAMDSAHAQAAVLLIEAGADRSRVSDIGFGQYICPHHETQMNQEQETPEDMQGVGGVEQTRAKQYVIERCGKA